MQDISLLYISFCCENVHGNKALNSPQPHVCFEKAFRAYISGTSCEESLMARKLLLCLLSPAAMNCTMCRLVSVLEKDTVPYSFNMIVVCCEVSHVALSLAFICRWGWRQRCLGPIWWSLWARRGGPERPQLWRSSGNNCGGVFECFPSSGQGWIHITHYISLFLLFCHCFVTSLL